jgi:hypothetical protein
MQTTRFFMPRFTADCSRCCGLCCFVPAYLKEQGFPLDKPVERSCPHLERTGLCGIHPRRVEMGFGACCSFDCHGAGQWITQQFGGACWQDSATIARAMADAWNRWLPRFEAAALLEAALPLVGRRAPLEARIDELLDPARDIPFPTDRRRLRQETLAFIRTLLEAQRQAAAHRDLD